MFQKEVAQRICEPPGTKNGILSVLTQLFYEAKYNSQFPRASLTPPKVDSGYSPFNESDYTLDCDEKLLFKIVKMSFQQRRKTLRNSLKTLGLPKI